MTYGSWRRSSPRTGPRIRCARTTLDIDSSVLEQLRRRQRSENKSLGQLVSELLAHALAVTETVHPPAPLAWTATPMRARVDLEDRDAVQRILDAGA